MLLIKTYKGRHSKHPKHTLKVIHNNKVLNVYECITCNVLETLLKSMNHVLIERVNVSNALELKK